MPYITIRQSSRYHQITLEEILRGEVALRPVSGACDPSGTVTRFYNTVSEQLVCKSNIPGLIKMLQDFCQKHIALYETDRLSLYDTFYIPKRSGGLRKINAPYPPLDAALRELRTMFEVNMGALYHTAAFAYVEGRSTISAIQRHQANESKWFEKTDFADFFGSTTPGFLLSSLSIIFPFSEIVKSEEGKSALSKALDLCFLNGGLPQGTPISPMLTNLVMIPIDHRLANDLHKRSFVYTRYSDDIQISSRTEFDPNEIVQFIDGVLDKFKAPFRIKPQKTRYGSNAGRNWNLGLMLNKDNQITIGHQKKKQFKAMCNNYILDQKNHVSWDLSDVHTFNGLIAYYEMIEKEYILHVIAHYNEKYGVNLKAMIRASLKSGV